MSMGFHNDGSAPRSTNGKSFQQSRNLWRMLTSGHTWSKMLDKLVLGIIILAAIGAGFGLFFGRSSNTGGIVGTGSRVGKQLNPFVSNETKGLSDITGLGGQQTPSNYVSPDQADRTVKVERR